VYEPRPAEFPRREPDRPLQPSQASRPDDPVICDLGSKISPGPKTHSLLTSLGHAASPASTLVEPTFAATKVEVLENRIRQLELQLHLQSSHQSAGLPPDTPRSIETGLSDSFYVHPNKGDAQARNISRSVSHETRLFGQSHWVNSVLHVRCYSSAL
jgi:hypothetical protein